MNASVVVCGQLRCLAPPCRHWKGTQFNLIADPQLLEPVMAVEVVRPAESLGDCIGDLNRRRGLVRGQSLRGTAIVVDAQVPLSEMFSYIGQLRALSSGRASFSMLFEQHALAPRKVRDAVAIA